MPRRFLCAAAAAFALGAAQAQTPDGSGVVRSIEETQQTSTAANVVGAIGGALLGGWLGSQVGGGTGRVIASTAAGIGGSMAGSSVASKYGAKTVWIVSIRYDDGIDRRVSTEDRPGYRPGDKVRVEGGKITRS